MLFKVFRELGWGEELGSGCRNIKKFAPLYYDKSVIEITNKDHFIFSITYDDSVKSETCNSVNLSADSVNSSVDSVNAADGGVKTNSDIVNLDISVGSKSDQPTNDEIEKTLSTLVEGLNVSKIIRKRMLQELMHIYHSETINRASLLEVLNYTATQMKGDLHVLMQEGMIIFSAKDKTYSLSMDVLAKIKM